MLCRCAAIAALLATTGCAAYESPGYASGYGYAPGYYDNSYDGGWYDGGGIIGWGGGYPYGYGHRDDHGRWGNSGGDHPSSVALRDGGAHLGYGGFAGPHLGIGAGPHLGIGAGPHLGIGAGPHLGIGAMHGGPAFAGGFGHASGGRG